MNPFGLTRSRLTPTHALITPESHVQAPLPGWTGTQGIVLISPRMGARFSQYVALMDAGAEAAMPPADVSRFFWVEEGRAQLDLSGSRQEIDPEGFAYLPANEGHRLRSESGCRLTVFEKPWTGRGPGSAAIVGHERNAPAEPFLGDEGAMLQKLLPESEAIDLAVNRFTFTPGAALPLVETHVMEHGLLMLQGMGVYRLNDDWYPVAQGDVIWMAPYCPQWFVAAGKEPARYLYYKDMHYVPTSDV